MKKAEKGTRSKKILFFRLLGIFSLCAVLICGTVFALPSRNKDGDSYTIAKYNQGLVSTEDLYNASTGGFNATPYIKLSEALLGTGKTPKDLMDAALAAGTTGSPTKSEITVKIGGLNWIPVYLSKSISGKPVLTLWLSGADTSAAPSTYGQQVVNTNGAFSTFTTGFSPQALMSATWPTPPNEYGSSYIRAVALNNGGNFVTDIGIADGNGGRKPNPASVGLMTQTNITTSAYEVINWDTQAANATNNKFYQFTQGGIANRIITPSDIAWQRDQKNAVTQTQAVNGSYWNFFNESYTTVDPVTTFINYNGNDYQTKNYYGQWANDKVWMPSYTEVGNGDGTNGLWKTTIEQRKTGTGSRGYGQWITYTNNTYFIGYQCYLRTAEFVFSGGGNNCHGALIMAIDENGVISPVCTQTYGTCNTFYTRPCIHLDLEYTQAENATVEYNGNDWAVDTNLAGATLYDSTDTIDWFDPMVSTVKFFKDSARTQALTSVYDAGTYYGRVSLNASELSAGRTWSDGTTAPKDFTLTIKKKRIKMLTPQVTSDGGLQNGTSIQSTDSSIPYVHDVGQSTAPDFDLQYRRDGSGVWSNTKPTTAGKYYARPYIKNDTQSNYEIDYSQNCEVAFTKAKQKVALPWFSNSTVTSSDISGSTTTVQYDGTWQVFDLYNATDNTLTGVTAGGRSNGLQLAVGTNKFQARDVGTYTLTVYLADNGQNTEWSDAATNTATTRTVTLEIKKKEIAVTFDNDTVTSWEHKQRNTVDITATGVIAGENPPSFV